MNWEHCRTQSTNLFLSKVWTLRLKISLTQVLNSSLTHFFQLHIMTAVIVNFLFWFCPHFVGLKTLLSVYKVLVFGNLVTILAKLQQMLFIRQNTIMIYIGYQSVEILILILLLSVQKKTIVYFDIYTWPLYVSYSVGFRWKPFNLINSLFHESQERQNQSFVQSRLLWRLQSVWWPRSTCFFILLLHLSETVIRKYLETKVHLPSVFLLHLRAKAIRNKVVVEGNILCRQLAQIYSGQKEEETIVILEKE